MNDVIKSGNIIKKIRDGKQLEEIALFARKHRCTRGTNKIK